MTLTLTADIDAQTRYLHVTGTVPDSIQGGYRFRLGDEALELQGFVMPQHTVTVDRNRWYVRRAQDGSAAASHTTGTEIKGANDAFISATSGTTPPNPFAGGGGSGFANPATEDLDMATHAITNLVAGVAASDAATVGQLGGGGGPFALSRRVLTADTAIPDNMGAVVVGPLDLNGFSITFGANAAIAILEAS